MDHKLAEVMQNIERLRLETQKFEVWGTGAKEGVARGRVPLGRSLESPPPPPISGLCDGSVGLYPWRGKPPY